MRYSRDQNLNHYIFGTFEVPFLVAEMPSLVTRRALRRSHPLGPELHCKDGSRIVNRRIYPFLRIFIAPQKHAYILGTTGG